MKRKLPPACRRPNGLIHRFVWFAALAWPLAGLLSGNGVSSAAAPPNEGAAPFVLHEMFGVAHPDQIVTFDLSQSVDPQRTILVADDGSEVPYQLIAGGRQLAVRTGLAAGERKLFSPRPGKPAATFQDAVTVRETSAYYEIVNGLTGVRVPKAAATADTDRLPAPVQGVLLRDGKWYGTGPNWLEYQSAADWTKRTVATGMSVTMLERGPLKTVVQVDYRFEHPELKYGQQMLKPAGQGYYTSTITVQAGQPSVLFEEDTDFEPKWSIELYDAVQPTHARYRGHHSSDAKFGYEPDGQRYRAANERGYDCDAEVELHYDQPRSPSYRSSEDTWRLMCVWDPWCFDSGWYWQAFRRDAPESANVVGIFAGPASRAIGAHMSGVGISTAPTGADGKPAFALNLTSYRRGPDARVFPRSRWCWGLFAGTRADIRPAAEVQPINLQMNLHGGVNLNQVHRWTLDFPDPPEGYGTAFMSRQAIDALKTRVRDDPAYFQWLYNNDTYTRPLFDAWRDPGREKLAVCLEQIFRQSHDMLQALVHQGGIYHFSVHYWHGGLAAQRYGVWIDQLLGDPRLTAEERARLKAAAVLFANLVWNDDHAPISSTDHGLNLGTENMPIQQWGYRRFYALFLARHPTMVERAKQVERQLEATVDQVINDSGAEIGCTHYIGASFVPTLNTLLQVKQLGGTDPFRDWPKLAKFAEFFLNLQTPPEPRMGGKRALVTLGDSGVETSEIFGLLGTGFRDADPRLSKRLMEAWAAGGKQHSFFFGTTTVMIDDTLAPSPGPVASGQEPARAGEAPAAPPRSSVATLADATFPGYCSVLRHGWNTPDETALFFVNGDFYRDHRHHDHGSVALYALGKPVSVDWSAIYTPHAPGAYVHSMVVPEAAIGHAWNKDGALLSGDQVWRSSTQTAFRSLPDRAYARATFERDKLRWTRAVTVVRTNPSQPIIVICDRFAGEEADVPKVASLNLMAVGPVVTPAGSIEPPQRTHPTAQRQEDPAVLPSATKPVALPPGSSEFRFTGRYDVDFAVYSLGNQPREFLLGNWANTAWGGAVIEREERQHILRVRGSGPFITVVVAWRRDAKPQSLHVTEDGNAVVVTAGDVTTRIFYDESAAADTAKGF
jgi:hypothetical protein